MFGSLGGPEVILILVIALIVFGPRRLPEIGKSMGKMLAEFRKASTDFKRTIEDEVEAEKAKESPPPATVNTIDPAAYGYGAPTPAEGGGAASPGGAEPEAPASPASEPRADSRPEPRTGSPDEPQADSPAEAQADSPPEPVLDRGRSADDK